MTDLERISRAIWADRAARILAEDIAAKREEGSPGHMTYDELCEEFQRGLLSEAKSAVAELRRSIFLKMDDAWVSVNQCENDNENFRRIQFGMKIHYAFESILNGENETTA